MFTSTIGGIEVPLIVARRSKGYANVLANFHVFTKAFADPLVFIKYLADIPKVTFPPSALLDLTKTIRAEEKLSTVEVLVDFPLVIERVSPTFIATAAEVFCSYRATVTTVASSLEMLLTMPAAVFDIYPRPAKLMLGITKPSKALFFEDLWDFVQKYGGYAIYPLGSPEDKAKVSELLSQQKTPYDSLVAIRDGIQKAKVGSGGRISLSFSDVYALYDFSHSVAW